MQCKVNMLKLSVSHIIKRLKIYKVKLVLTFQESLDADEIHDLSDQSLILIAEKCPRLSRSVTKFEQLNSTVCGCDGIMKYFCIFCRLNVHGMNKIGEAGMSAVCINIYMSSVL